jgi:hypothetical protein
MNRHERRRAAALGRRPGYLHRIVGAMRAGALPKSGVHHAIIEHDRTCGTYRGAACNCVPDISISGPDNVTVIDECGVGRKVAKS